LLPFRAAETPAAGAKAQNARRLRRLTLVGSHDTPRAKGGLAVDRNSSQSTELGSAAKGIPPARVTLFGDPSKSRSAVDGAVLDDVGQ